MSNYAQLIDSIPKIIIKSVNNHQMYGNVAKMSSYGINLRKFSVGSSNYFKY